MSLLAHGIGGVRDLPVPQWLFLYVAGAVLAVSFGGLALLWRRPALERRAAGRPLPDGVSRVLLSRPVRALLGAIGFGLLGLVLAAAFAGQRSTATNLAPTFVWVGFWLGMVPLVVLFGNVWQALSPWKAAADGVGFLAGRLLRSRPEPFRYPEWLGVWPAAVGLFCFTAMELAYHDPADPRALARAITFYSLATWLGALAFGSEAWFARGDAFSVYFGLLARIAPFEVRDEDGRRRIVVRPPFLGLTRLGEPAAGTLGFVAVMLGSVAFDGFSRTALWQDRTITLDQTARSLAGAAGLLGAVLAVAAAYLLAVRAGKIAAATERNLVRPFLASLVPIALVYAVSHYFTLLVIQGQVLYPLASDPFGFGWNLFGTTGYSPNLSPFTPNTVWYVQVAVLVVGHVVGLALAHDRALELFPDRPRRALQTQYPMLVLMVAYTVGGLWLLSQG